MNNRRSGKSHRTGSTRDPRPSRYGNRMQNSRAPRVSSSLPVHQNQQARPTDVNFIEKWPDRPEGNLPVQPVESQSRKKQPFRVLIAVHRPRYRGRTDRASEISGWQVTSLLNKQDVVGQVQKGDQPPDIVVLSADFGRQKSLGIFRAIQEYRSRGMKIVGLVDDCNLAPEGLSVTASDLCDVCLPPPYKTAELRALLLKLYEEIRGVPIDPSALAANSEVEDEEADL